MISGIFMHTCMMPVAPNRLVNISSVLEYASVLIGVHQVKIYGGTDNGCSKDTYG
mgnify:CR=1 FL=1